MAFGIEGLVVFPALIIGVVIGLVELFFVHSDEAGMGWFMHGLHALPFTILFVFVSMNISFVLGMLNLAITETWYVDLGIRILVGIIAMVKIGSAAAIVGRIGERWYHTIAIGVLIILAPYAWDLAEASITPLLPVWMQ